MRDPVPDPFPICSPRRTRRLGLYHSNRSTTKPIRDWLDHSALERTWTLQAPIQTVNQLASLFDWSIEQRLIEVGLLVDVVEERERGDARSLHRESLMLRF